MAICWKQDAGEMHLSAVTVRGKLYRRGRRVEKSREESLGLLAGWLVGWHGTRTGTGRL